MARWKLVAPHYLNIPGEEWQYEERDRSGKLIRKLFPVPKLLHPDDPNCWTNRWGGQGNEDGQIIVCHDGKGEANDQVFYGDPTPDMIPMDDEAKALTASFEERWRYKPEEGTVSHSQSIVDRFQEELADVEARAKNQSMDALADSIKAMAEANQAILRALIPAQVERRV